MEHLYKFSISIKTFVLNFLSKDKEGLGIIISILIFSSVVGFNLDFMFKLLLSLELIHSILFSLSEILSYFIRLYIFTFIENRIICITKGN